MAISARNNLAPESQAWASQVSQQATGADSIARQALNLANTSAAALAGLANSVGSAMTRTVAINCQPDMLEDLFCSMPVPVDPDSHAMTINITGGGYSNFSFTGSSQVAEHSLGVVSGGLFVAETGQHEYVPASQTFWGVSLSLNCYLLTSEVSSFPTFNIQFTSTLSNAQPFQESYPSITGSITYIMGA